MTYDIFRLAPLLLSGGNVPPAPDTITDADIAAHNALIDKFRQRIIPLQGASIVKIFNRAADLSSRTAMEAAFRRDLPEGLVPEPFLMDITWENRAPYAFRLAFPPRHQVIFPERLGDPQNSCLFKGIENIGVPLRKGLISSIAIQHATLCHETLGHATENIAMPHAFDRELRADIAALCGIMKDTGDTRAAETLIALRQVIPLRRIHETNPPDYEHALGLLALSNIADYATGPGLKQAWGLVGACITRDTTDAGLIRMVDTLAGAGKTSQALTRERCRVLAAAYQMAREALSGEPSFHDRIAGENPELLAQANEYLFHCAEALVLLCEVEASELGLQSSTRAIKSAILSPKPR